MMSLTFGKNRHPITKERLGVPRVLGFVTLLSCSWIAPAIAQVATEGKGQGVEFRTIYVPENRPESWPTVNDIMTHRRCSKRPKLELPALVSGQSS
ncbi:MAG: hypothetical protein RID07_04570, partial [Lacipirellulaceae bacterium]